MAKPRSLRLLFVCVLAGCVAGAWPQGTKADYDRAMMVRGLGRDRVFKANVQPRWFDGNSKFWYRNDLAGGAREYVLVDAVSGRKAPAFDHAKLGGALSKATGKQVKADRLPIEMLDFSTVGHVLALSGGKVWDCRLADYTLTEKPNSALAVPSLPRLRRAHPSLRTGDETTVNFINELKQKVELFWVSTEGARSSYGTLAPGERRVMHTYAGHVWVAVGADGREVGAWESAEQPGNAVIDDKPAPTSFRGRTRTTFGMEPDRGAQNRKWVAFEKDHNVWLRPTGGGAEVQLTNDGTADDGYGNEFHWSPDGTRLVGMKTKAGQEHKVYEVESSPRDQVQPKLHTLDYLKPGDRIALTRPHLFDVDAHKEIPIKDELFPNPWSVEEVRWRPDSKHFTFEYNQRGHQVYRVISVDRDTGAASAIVDETSKTFIDYAGKHYSDYLDDTGELIWMSERDGWNHLYLIDLETGQVKNQVTKGEWVVRRVVNVDAAKRQMWFELGGYYPGQDPYYIHHARVNFDGTGLTLLTQGNGTHRLDYSPDGRFYMDTYSRVDVPPITELRRSSDGKPVCELEKGDASALLKTGWRAPEPFVAKGRDGKTDICGVIFRPTKLDPGKKYPVIENIYAGPQSSYVPKGWSAFHGGQDLAELGFIVVQIDGMGTSNRSKAFHDVCWHNLADAGFPDRILWMKAAAAKYPYMDVTRVGIGGGSAGGQNAMAALLWHPEFYKVGIADSGCHDNRMDKIWWNELWMGWPVGPWYDENSNVTNAYKLQGKLMLIYGELDNNVDPASTMQVVNVLVRAGKDFDLLAIPGGGHCPGGSPYGWRRQADFYVRNLLSVEPRR